MTPQAIVSTLLEMKEEKAQHFLRSQVPLLSAIALERLVYYLKREADRQWVTDVNLSFTLSGYLLLIGNITHNKYYFALGLMARGDALRRMDRDQDALPFFDAAGEEFLALEDEVGWARTRIGRVSACLRLNRPTEALRDAARAHDIFVRYGKLRRAGQIDVNAAIINFELGHYDQALRLFDRAIQTYLQHGEGVDLNIARALGNKALTLAAQGKFREAAALHEQARTTFAEYDEEISVAREDLNVASINAAQGHYGRALLLYEQSRTLFLKHGMQPEAAEVAQQMCDCLLHLNRAQDAYELAGETVRFFRSAPGQRHNLARSLMFQADAATLQGNFLEADEMLAEASVLLEEGGLVRLVALVRLQRAHLYFADGLLADSSREVQYVADAFAEQEDLPHLARALLLQARVADAQHQESLARDLCDRALDIAHNQGLLELTYLCLDLLGRLAERGGDLDVAALYYDRAIEGIDEVQSRLVLDERTSFLEDKGSIYQRAITLALRRDQTDQALMYVEKAKSQVLGDYLRNNIDIRLRASDKAGEAILEHIAHLREEQAWFGSIVYHTEDGASLTNLGITTSLRLRAISPQVARQEMQSRERRIERLLEQMQLRSAGDLLERPRSVGVGLAPVRRSIPPQTVMLEYYLTDRDLYIFSLSHEGIDVQIVSGVVSKLERLLSLWRTNLDLAGQAAGGPDQAHGFLPLQANGLGLLKRIYDLLIRPVSDILSECTHLTIIPYGILHVLPFHCLFDGVQFVVERFSVSYLPSASLADICYGRGQRIRERGVSLNQSLVLGFSDGGRLSYAVQEAETVARQFLQHPHLQHPHLQYPRDGSKKSNAQRPLPSGVYTQKPQGSSDFALGTVCALDDAATSSLLWERGPTSPIIHIAAHGLFRLDAPNFSYIKLADRQLSSIEVFNLDLSACSLIVLSACETGRSVVGGIDEVIGLGRGFLYAGAASLLPTLWKVDDASSAELMQVFYQALLQGQTKAVALSHAQRTFLAQARASTRPYRVHPYFWAAFHLIGDVGAIQNRLEKEKP
jgi:tetratricopeptide (TPR) repeat protein